MRGRPPKKPLTPEQQDAADSFIDGAGGPAAGDATSAPHGARSTSTPRPASPRARRTDPDALPWEAPFVRDDVVKGYALRLPEPLYLKLKYVADTTGRSMNRVCRDAIEAAVEGALRGAG